MKFRRLLRTNLDVSEVSFGCMSLGENHTENQALIRAAFDGNINYFDTADIYQNGFNEESVGRAIKPFRQQVVLATKVGNVPNETASNWEWNPTKSYILKAAEKSLKRLGTDYIDVYQLHGGMIEDDWEETVEAFEILKGKGMIRSYGLSSIRPNVIRRFAEKTQVVSNMIQYSLLDRRPEESVLEVLASSQVGVIVRGGLARGLLAGKDSSSYLDYGIKDVDILKDKMKSFSIEKMSIAQLALKWILKDDRVTTVVAGIRKMEQLNDILGLNDAPSLSDDVVNELSNTLRPNRYLNHR